jgi:hypothetical protein
MQIVPIEAAQLFDLKAAILGWLLAAVQPKKQHPGHKSEKPYPDLHPNERGIKVMQIRNSGRIVWIRIRGKSRIRIALE